MLNRIKINSREKILIIYVFLAAMALAVFWQVNQFDFVNLDDPIYVVENHRIQSGFTWEGIRWAFGTTYAEFWHPLTWLTLMLDYQLFGLNAGGYHMTNVILHIMSTLLLFWLFYRMTGAVWKSAFVAAIFAIHPLHVESVAWIAERKDVLSGFFWMLTLCVYVYYTEKPVMKRYLLVCLSFICGLMSKSTVVTLPVIMILLDYWPLRRFELQRGKVIAWQLKEKTIFFILSVIFAVITLLAQPPVRPFPLEARLANASVSLIIYLSKIFWPHDLAVFYPYPSHMAMWHLMGASFLIIIITAFVIAMRKRLPYLFVGWFGYIILILPVIGIVQVGNHAMADRYMYLPLIGIAVIIAWSVNLFSHNGIFRKKILFLLSIIFLTILMILSWQQCSYWQHDKKLFMHALRVTENNFMAHFCLGIALGNEGKNQEAIEHCNKAIHIKPNYANAYNCRGAAYYNKGQYEQALRDCEMAIDLQPHDARSYYYRGLTYHQLQKYPLAIESFDKAISLNPHHADFYDARGNVYSALNQYQRAIENYNRALWIKSNNVNAYKNRGFSYLRSGNTERGCNDLRKACELGDCQLLNSVKGAGYCR